MKYFVQFTGRKKDPRTGERCRWHWGPYDRDAAEERADHARKAVPRLARVDVVRRGGSKRPTRGEQTREGMARARARGVHVGRPRKVADPARMVDSVLAWAAVLGSCAQGARRVAEMRGLSLSTVKRLVRDELGVKRVGIE